MADATIIMRRRELVRFGSWLKGRRPKRALEAVGADFVVGFVSSRAPFHSRSTVSSVVSILRSMGEFLVLEGVWSVNRQVTILKNFYRALVAMAQLEPDANPMASFPKIKAAPSKLPTFLSEDETRALLAQPSPDTVLGIRDRAILTLLYGTGIRVTECATLMEGDVDLADMTVRVLGKGGHERVLPLNPAVARVLRQYREVRGKAMPATPFFRSREGAGMTRFAVYQRVRLAAQRARIGKRVSPHRLRHTFATHLVKHGVQLVTIRDLLGHHCISSTQIYLHTTADDLRKAATVHPVERLVAQIADLLPNVKVPFQWLPGQKVVHRL